MLYSEPHTLMKNKLNIIKYKNIIKNMSVMSNNINHVKNANLERDFQKRRILYSRFD